MKRRTVTLLSVLVFAICSMTAIHVYAAENVITDSMVSLSKTAYLYDGTLKKPAVKVIADDGTVLKKNVSYSVTYKNNRNAGTATVVVTAKGSYTGSVEKNYTIKRRDINSSLVKIKVSRVTRGKSPTLSVKFNGNTMYREKSYVITAKNISSLGDKKGYITIKGVGNYTGMRTKRFTVRPRKVTGVSTTSRDSESVTIEWKSQKNDGVSGYRVYTCDKDGKNIKFYADVKKNECALIDMYAGEYKHIYVRSYKKSSGKIFYGEMSKLFTTCSKPEKVITCGAVNSGDGKYINVYVKQVPCTGYIIEYSTDSSFKKNVKVVQQYGKTKTKIKIKIKNNKKYYFRARAYRRFNNGRSMVYGPRGGKASNKFSNVYASFTTYYSTDDYNRCQNLAKACKYINGTVLLPGETFSFNEVVGPRTSKKGFKPATIFKNGGHADAVGGGICQVSTTLFNAALEGNFNIVMRRQHSQRVLYVPLGRDAAMYKDVKDFRFKNNTNHVIKIKMSASGGKLTCRMMTCKKVNPKKVKIEVKYKDGKYVLKRYVGGKCNYTTESKY